MIAGLGSPTHLILILVVILLLFGAKRLPEIGRSIGQGVNEFKEGLSSKDEPDSEDPEVIEGARGGAGQGESGPGDGSQDEKATHAKGLVSSN